MRTSPQVMLLQDIQQIFKERGCERMHSKELVERLIELEERPWCGNGSEVIL